jgi:hypothetical protein
MIASVEAIFLPTFVLISENGMAAAADKRVDRCPADPLAGALQNRRLREERRHPVAVHTVWYNGWSEHRCNLGKS